MDMADVGTDSQQMETNGMQTVICSTRCGDVYDDSGVRYDCGACRSEERIDALMDDVNTAISRWFDYGYMQDVIAIDVPSIRVGARERIARTEGSEERALLRAIWHVAQAFKNGHSGVYRTDALCRNRGGADTGYSSYGVCAKPFEDHFVVTHQPGGSSPLGLLHGDQIMAYNGMGGSQMITAILDNPICGFAPTHEDGEQEMAAESLFSILKKGDKLSIKSFDGSTRDVVVSDDGIAPASCLFPRDAQPDQWFNVTVRADDIAVFRITRFTLRPGEPGYVEANSEETIARLIENMTQQLEEAIEALPGSTKGVVWDIRGNTGGVSPVGFAIASGMQGARAVEIARCTTKVTGTIPSQFLESGPNYDLTPSERLSAGVPAALLIDGMSISAADYFARAVSLGTDARIFGRPSLGAFGGVAGSIALPNAAQISIAFDVFKCNDSDGLPLETQPVQPHEKVEYDPVDLTQGIDTVLERAALWLKEQT